MREVILAKSAGFCFGVRRAVEAARSAAPAWTLGPVIHNPRVVAELAEMGVVSADAPEDIPKARCPWCARTAWAGKRFRVYARARARYATPPVLSLGASTKWRRRRRLGACR